MHQSISLSVQLGYRLACVSRFALRSLRTRSARGAIGLRDERLLQKTEFPTVRTFAQQATHVAEANYFFASLISGVKPDVDTKAFEKLTSKDDVVAALAGSFAFSHKAVATLTPENAWVVIKSPEPGFATHATMAAFLVAHANDHYGQMVEYLRMNAIVPPASAR